MRKDYLEAAGQHDHETAFVEDYWTRVWEKEGGPKGAIGRIPAQDEYRVMRPRLPPGALLLDAVCGLGDWVLALAREGFDITGLDISRRTVSQLQARFPEAKFACGDIRASGLPDASFDACYSWGVFEHFEAGPQDCLRETMRLLRPGGLLFVSVPLDNLRHALLGALGRGDPGTPGLRFYQYRFTRAELARELGIAGFDVLALHPIHKRQGVLRCLHHEFGMAYDWFATKALSALLAPLLPGWAIAHMVLAVARKRG